MFLFRSSHSKILGQMFLFSFRWFGRGNYFSLFVCVCHLPLQVCRSNGGGTFKCRAMQSAEIVKSFIMISTKLSAGTSRLRLLNSVSAVYCAHCAPANYFEWNSFSRTSSSSFLTETLLSSILLRRCLLKPFPFVFCFCFFFFFSFSARVDIWICTLYYVLSPIDIVLVFVINISIVCILFTHSSAVCVRQLRFKFLLP